MTAENETLLMRDLIARLPYGVKLDFYAKATKSHYTCELIGIEPENNDKPLIAKVDSGAFRFTQDHVKLFLRPMSSMTDMEKSIYEALTFTDDISKINPEWCSKVITWLNENHFDYNHLIEKGLALEAPEGMYAKSEGTVEKDELSSEESELLRKDLFARLPYGIFVKEKRDGLDNSLIIYTDMYHPLISSCRPYLRPMQSMTEEEFNKYRELVKGVFSPVPNNIEMLYDFLNGRYFDYRGLIAKGLALKAPDDMYNNKKNNYEKQGESRADS